MYIYIYSIYIYGQQNSIKVARSCTRAWRFGSHGPALEQYLDGHRLHDGVATFPTRKGDCSYHLLSNTGVILVAPAPRYV